MDTITRDDIVAGKEYTPKPGTRYEIAPGIIATLKPDTFEAIEAFDVIPNEDRPAFDVVYDRLQVVVTVPDGFNNWKGVSSVVAWRVVEDFLRIVAPVAKQPSESSTT